MTIAERIEAIKKILPKHTTLVAVSKTKPISMIEEAYRSGHRVFGENKVQELVEKHEQLPKDIHWHMIGHLQTNKVKYIAPFVDLIHSADSSKLVREVDKQASKNKRIIDVLLQLRIAEEDSKFGLKENEAQELFEDRNKYPNIRITGVMGMATNTDDTKQIKNEFLRLKSFFEKLRTSDRDIKDISMGMTGDYLTAIDCGSTMIRIGSSIFGDRKNLE